MIRIVALYRKPEDPDSFMDHYLKVHLPLVRRTPGLAELKVSRVLANAFGGEAPYFLITEMAYPDRATFDAAMRSEENRAVARDASTFPPGILTALICEDLDQSL